jgi:hypothetical protein
MKPHTEHIKGGYFVLNCKECETFMEKYLNSGRKWKEAMEDGI